MVELGILLFYLFGHFAVGHVYISDEMSAIYDSLKTNTIVREAEAIIPNDLDLETSTSGVVNDAQQPPLSLRKSMFTRTFSSSKVNPQRTSSVLNAMRKLVAADDTPKALAFGSDEEFLTLMGQRMEFEDQLAREHQEVYIALGGCLTAICEDLPQLIVNSYRVVTGCGKGEAATCGSFCSNGQYLWTAADTAIFFYSLKSAGFFLVKLQKFQDVVEKRSRIEKLKELIKEKTAECKANRAMQTNAAEFVTSPPVYLNTKMSPADEVNASAEEKRVSVALNKKMIARIMVLESEKEEILKRNAALENAPRRGSIFS